MILVPMVASLFEGFFADDQPPVLEQQGQNGPALLWQWGVRQQRCVPTHDRFGGQHLGLAQARESTAVVTQYGQQSILVSAERFPDQADEFLAARGLGGTGFKVRQFPGFGKEDPRLGGQHRNDGAVGGADEPCVFGMSVFFRLLQRGRDIQTQPFGRDGVQRGVEATVFAQDVLRSGLHV
jgi:hypothetical protein